MNQYADARARRGATGGRQPAGRDGEKEREKDGSLDERARWIAAAGGLLGEEKRFAN